jgi:hypothetical protein
MRLSESFSTDETASLEMMLSEVAKAQSKAFAQASGSSTKDSQDGETTAPSKFNALLLKISSTLLKLGEDSKNLRSSTKDLAQKVKLKPSETWDTSQSLRPPTIADKSKVAWSTTVVPQLSVKEDMKALPLGSLRSIGAALTERKLNWRQRLTKYAKRFPELPPNMAGDPPKPTVFTGEVKAAMQKQPGLGLIAEICPEIQKRELQLWKSLAWIRSEFDTMVKAGRPVFVDDKGSLALYSEASAPQSLEKNSHIILSSKDMVVIHELLFAAEQLALASPAKIANKLRSRLLSQWHIPAFQKSDDDVHALFSKEDMEKASKAAKQKADFQQITGKRKNSTSWQNKNDRSGRGKNALFGKPPAPNGGGGQKPKPSPGKKGKKNRARCAKCEKWYKVGAPCKN